MVIVSDYHNFPLAILYSHEPLWATGGFYPSNQPFTQPLAVSSTKELVKAERQGLAQENVSSCDRLLIIILQNILVKILKYEIDCIAIYIFFIIILSGLNIPSLSFSGFRLWLGSLMFLPRTLFSWPGAFQIPQTSSNNTPQNEGTYCGWKKSCITLDDWNPTHIYK